MTGIERIFDSREVIVSKTDPRGKITYANPVFIRVSQFSEEELLGAPHKIVRHPKMPRCVFKLLWDTLRSGQEIFAYVLNRAKSGDHYWVFAHVTPTVDGRGFAVVAGEVKNLSGETAQASQRIEKQVLAIRTAAQSTAGFIQNIWKELQNTDGSQRKAA